ISTTWRKNYFFKRIFKVCWERTKCCKKEKRTLLGAPTKVSALSCVAAENLHLGTGILTGFPFEGEAQVPTLKRNYPIS
ncbi:hypothetical protein P153DRAFT_304110, partial [Dothidotthia symphoricarpi CBS 119687]